MLLTAKEKRFLLEMLKGVQIGGRRDQIKATMKLIDDIERKIEASPTGDEKEETPAPERKKPRRR